MEHRPVTFFLWLWLSFYCTHNDNPVQDIPQASNLSHSLGFKTMLLPSLFDIHPCSNHTSFILDIVPTSRRAERKGAGVEQRVREVNACSSSRELCSLEAVLDMKLCERMRALQRAMHRRILASQDSPQGVEYIVFEAFTGICDQ